MNSPQIRNLASNYLAKVSAAYFFLWYDFERPTSVNIDTAHCDSRQRVCPTITFVYAVPPKVS